ncbi:HTH domain-containing protein [Methylococcaceae bacterium WWC4]|nr:HTH domain-containing protein [Methylococcaceae bacterium WWC4]
MNVTTGSRQEQILTLLLDAPSGLCIDELAAALGISRNAVKQHLAGLEKDQLIREAAWNSTGGRPSRSYGLTEAGRNRLPKQYAWFSTLLLDQLRNELGEAGLRRLMWRTGENLAETLAPRFAGKSLAERTAALVELMQSLGYHANLEDDTGQIRAINCVYHDMAQRHPELCEFDRALIATLLERPIEQTACMAKQDCTCRFKCLAPPD